MRTSETHTFRKFEEKDIKEITRIFSTDILKSKKETLNGYLEHIKRIGCQCCGKEYLEEFNNIKFVNKDEYIPFDLKKASQEEFDKIFPFLYSAHKKTFPGQGYHIELAKIRNYRFPTPEIIEEELRMMMKYLGEAFLLATSQTEHIYPAVNVGKFKLRHSSTCLTRETEREFGNKIEIETGEIIVFLPPRTFSGQGISICLTSDEKVPPGRPYFHPHASMINTTSRISSLCTGEAGASLQQAASIFSMLDIVDLVKAVLSTYNANSPYCMIEYWMYSKCGSCGYFFKPEEKERECSKCKPRVKKPVPPSPSHAPPGTLSEALRNVAINVDVSATNNTVTPVLPDNEPEEEEEEEQYDDDTDDEEESSGDDEDDSDVEDRDW